jgi:hypothetical protein
MVERRRTNNALVCKPDQNSGNCLYLTCIGGDNVTRLLQHVFTKERLLAEVIELISTIVCVKQAAQLGGMYKFFIQRGATRQEILALIHPLTAFFARVAP